MINWFYNLILTVNLIFTVATFFFPGFIIVSIILLGIILIFDCIAKKKNIKFYMKYSKGWITIALVSIYVLSLILNSSTPNSYLSMAISFIISNFIFKLAEVNDESVKKSKFKVMIYNRIVETIDNLIRVLSSISIYNNEIIKKILKEKNEDKLIKKLGNKIKKMSINGSELNEILKNKDLILNSRDLISFELYEKLYELFYDNEVIKFLSKSNYRINNNKIFQEDLKKIVDLIKQYEEEFNKMSRVVYYKKDLKNIKILEELK